MRYEREFTIRSSDVIRFQQEVMLRGSTMLIVGVGLAGVVLAWLYVQWLKIEATPGEMALWILVTTMTTITMVCLSMAVTNRIQTKRHLKRMGKEVYQQKVLIDAFGVHVAADGKKAKAGFDKIHHVQESRRAFYIHLSPNHAWILLKDQMENAEDESRQIREIFDQVIESRRLKFLKQK